MIFISFLKSKGPDINFVARLFTNPGLWAGGKGKSILVGFSPNTEHVMMSSLKDTDVKVLRAKARRFCDSAF